MKNEIFENVITVIWREKTINWFNCINICVLFKYEIVQMIIFCDTNIKFFHALKPQFHSPQTRLSWWLFQWLQFDLIESFPGLIALFKCLFKKEYQLFWNHIQNNLIYTFLFGLRTLKYRFKNARIWSFLEKIYLY